MKNLVFLLTLMFASNVYALSCGETVSSTSSKESLKDVETVVPKGLEGATIVLSKADGSSEVLKAEDYMIVKRKHKRPVIKETTKEQTLACGNVNKNILSAKLVDGYSDVKKTETVSEAELRLERQVGIGVQYQRALTQDLYLGGEIDSNRGVGVILGVGF